MTRASRGLPGINPRQSQPRRHGGRGCRIGRPAVYFFCPNVRLAAAREGSDMASIGGPSTSVVLTAAALRAQLWNCADILRGSAVDRTDWKAYILPLLFFKRLCDVWDEETAEAART